MIGATIAGRYRIEKKIGQGGFAAVYLAHDGKLDREVAVKVLTTAEENESFRERFMRESRALANLNHPNILTVFDCGTHEDHEYIIMELINGPSLESLISKTSLAIPQVGSISLQTCQAMAYAHSQGIIHRDLTLRNIMLNQEDTDKARVKVLDFGLVKFIHSHSMTTGNAMMGTPAFLSPEQVLGREADGRVDIWAFGVGLFRVITGEYPFGGEHPAALMYSIVNETDIKFPDYMPGGYRDLISGCLKKDPGARIQTFDGIIDRLEAIRDSASGEASVQTTVMPNVSTFADRSSKRNPYLNRVMIKNPAEFIGREKEVRRIYSRLDAPQPQSISVVGERRIGKSSLLNYVYNRKNRKQFMQNADSAIFAYLDFQNTVDNSVARFIDLLFNVFSFETGDVTKYVQRPKTLDQLKEVIKELHEEGRRVIIMMDEFELITRNEKFEMDFFSFLRSLANSFRVAYVTSSREELQQMCHNKDISDSPFFNIFSNLPLKPFSRSEAVELITVLSEREGCPLASYSDRLIEMAGLFPFFLQIACCSLFDHLMDDPSSEPDWKDVRSMFEEEALPHYSFVWEKFDNAEKENLSRIAAGGATDRKSDFVNENLLRRGYLVKDDDGLALCSASFRDFVKRSGAAQAGGSKLSSILGRFRKKR